MEYRNLNILDNYGPIPLGILKGYVIFMPVIVHTTVGPAVESTPKRKSWLLPLWQTFRQGKDTEH